jgi:hypothetical protein
LYESQCSGVLPVVDFSAADALTLFVARSSATALGNWAAAAMASGVIFFDGDFTLGFAPSSRSASMMSADSVRHAHANPSAVWSFSKE